MIVCSWKDIGRYADVIPGLEEVIKAVEAMDSFEPGTIPLSGSNKILVQQGTTKPGKDQLLEAHREYLDIQYIVKGKETMGWAPLDTLKPAGEFNTEKDAGMFAGNCAFMDIAEGYCYVVFPEDAHMPARHLENPSQYTKLVVKLKV